MVNICIFSLSPPEFVIIISKSKSNEMKMVYDNDCLNIQSIVGKKIITWKQKIIYQLI